MKPPACEIYCGKFFLKEDGTLVPSCMCSAFNMVEYPTYKTAMKFMPRKVKSSFYNKKYKYIDDLNYNQKCIYNDWVKDLKNHIRIFNKVVDEHIKHRENFEDEYYPEEMEFPVDLIIPQEHYVKKEKLIA